MGYCPLELSFRKSTPSETFLKLERNTSVKELTFLNLTPLTRIADAYRGFDEMRIVDLWNDGNQIESGRFQLEFLRDDQTIECTCDQFEEITYEK